MMKYTLLAFVCASQSPCGVGNALPETYILDQGISREDCAARIASGFKEYPEADTSFECRAYMDGEAQHSHARPRRVPISNESAISGMDRPSYSPDPKIAKGQQALDAVIGAARIRARTDAYKADLEYDRSLLNGADAVVNVRGR